MCLFISLRLFACVANTLLLTIILHHVIVVRLILVVRSVRFKWHSFRIGRAVHTTHNAQRTKSKTIANAIKLDMTSVFDTIFFMDLRRNLCTIQRFNGLRLRWIGAFALKIEMVQNAIIVTFNGNENKLQRNSDGKRKHLMPIE